MRFRRDIQAASSAPRAELPGELRLLHRRRASRRSLAIFIIVALGAIAFLVNRARISADGLVIGELTQVAPLYQGRVTKLYARCLDHVEANQVIADVENALMRQSSSQQLQQLELELAEAQSTMEVAKQEAEAASKYRDAQAQVEKGLANIYSIQNQLLTHDITSTLAWNKAKYDALRAEAETAAADLVVQSKLQDSKRAEIDAHLLMNRIRSMSESPELMGRFQLKAPKAGYLTQCNAAIGAAVPANTVLFQIFNPNDAYAVIFVNPYDAARLTAGEQVSVHVGGVRGDVRGKIAGFYPELSGMPDSLTRYFWQQEKWSQFEPVRVDFEGLNENQQAGLRASAQVSVMLWRWPFG